MPHPHEQKLHEVVNSLTFESFKSFVAARIAGTSKSPPSASPDPPPKVSRNKSRRLIVGLGVPPSNDSSMGLVPAMADAALARRSPGAWTICRSGLVCKAPAPASFVPLRITHVGVDLEADPRSRTPT